MLRMSNKKRIKGTGKNNTKTDEKSVEKKSQYQEDFNEIILNDLVEDDKKIEFGVQEVSSSKQRKKGGLKFNLGLKKKKSQNTNTKSQDKNKQDSDKSKDKITGKDPQKEKDYNKGKSSSKLETETNKNKISNKKNISKKEKYSSNSEKNKSKNKGNAVSEKLKKGESKKTHSKNINIQREKSANEESKLIDSTNRYIEGYKETYENDAEDNLGSFRGIDEEIEIKKENQIIESKLKDLIWSEDKFPKN